MPNQNSTPWTDDITKRFVEHYNEGCSHSIIAARINDEFGTAFSRSASVARALRMQLPGRVVTYTNHTERVSRVQKPRAPEPVIGLGIDIMALNRNTCRWPLGEEVACTYCGLQTLEGSPWCAYHKHVAVRVVVHARAG